MRDIASFSVVPFPVRVVSSMVGRRISDEVKEMALSMSLQGLTDAEVHEFTGISVRSLKRLRSTHRLTGEVSRKPLTTGRPRNLTSMQRQFLCDCVERQPDIALSELQTDLRDVCGVDTSVQTVARSLQREGFTMKMVRHPFLPNQTLTTTTVDYAACSRAKRAGSR
jgi:transposase